jgi:flagellar motility protein MotE (MotC chaperone)
MKKWARDVRLMPIVLLAIVCLFALKAMGLFFDGGYTLGQRLGSASTLTVTTIPVAQTQQMRSPSVPLETPRQQSGPKLSWMQEIYGYPGGDRRAAANSANGNPDITGSVAAKPAEKPAEKKDDPKNQQIAQQVVPPAPESIAAGGKVVAMDQQRPASAGERALLERLQERRQELEARARELELRESLLKAAEKKLEAQGTSPDGVARGPNGQAGSDSPNPRLKSVVTMYETMKPKDAAKIFDRLDPKVLIEVASQIKPQRMSEIMAVMSPEAAERLTVELATQGPSERSVNPATLPKIDGKPTN